MHRFVIHDIAPDAHGRLDLDAIAHQLQRVLRVRPGETLHILNGHGLAYVTELLTLENRRATGQVHASIALPEPKIQLTLVQCALKADKFEWVLQKGTELGVSRFVPTLSTRTVVRPLATLEKKRQRWEAILREATEQCGRGKVPTLAPAVDWQQAIQTPFGQRPLGESSGSLPAQAAELRLLPWEQAAEGPDSSAGPVLSLASCVQNWRDSRPQTALSSAPAPASTPGSTPEPTHVPPLHIACAIGPEGGFEPQEVRQAQDAGWQVVHLGPHILRAETAALAAATLIMHIGSELDS